jgi:hypothetical protein
MLEIADLAGLWRRTLIVEPDGSRDETSVVDWLQGPSLYVDLRSPPVRPDFRSASLGDLSPEQQAYLGQQQGFAGRLRRDGAFFTWDRTIDLQPPGPFPDSGTLDFEGDVMVERGRHAAYLEHWRRGEEPTTPCAAFGLRDADGAEAILVASGDRFGFARARRTSLPPGATLEMCAAHASAEELRSIFDCEISMGGVDGGAFVVSRSSLPWLEGTAMRPSFAKGVVELCEGPSRGLWRIVEAEGDDAAFAR